MRAIINELTPLFSPGVGILEFSLDSQPTGHHREGGGRSSDYGALVSGASETGELLLATPCPLDPVKIL